MRPIGLLFGYLLAVFVGGAVLGSLLYFAAQELAPSFPALENLASKPFHRYASRGALAIALAGIWPLVRAIPLRKFDLGCVASPGGWRRFVAGLALGAGSLLVVAALIVAGSAAELALPATAVAWVRLFLTAALAGGAVGLIEELLFRGVILGALQKGGGPIVALVGSSVLYSALHFIAPARHVGEVHWWSGLALLPQLFGGMFDPQKTVPAFFTLVLAGVALGLARQRTGALWFSVGLHAGWVFCLKIYKELTATPAGAPGSLWGSDMMIDGWLAPVLMALIIVIVARWLRGGRPPLHDPAQDA